MEDYKKLLTDLYSIHDPERIKQIDYFLEKYKGKEKQFFISQKTKYKSKKLVSDSRIIIEEALERIKLQSEEKEKTDAQAESNEAIPESKKNMTVPSVSEIEKEKTEAAAEPQNTEISQNQTEIKPEKTIEEKEDTPPEKKHQAIPPAKAVVKEPQKVKGKRKNFFLIILGFIAVLIVIALLVYYFFFYASHKNTKETPVKDTKTTIIKDATKTESKIDEAPQTQQNITPIADFRIAKGSLNLPAYFVACYAVKDENAAVEKVNSLKEKGFESSYYWIPDFVPGGASYFKVVIGPFSTRKEAIQKLTPVQERAEFDAYVLELK